ncbi:hypothetical protein RHMOL_Rhmol04G0209700 [Rhododendron molle]|uniref:Uncharacterized protein n=1 Tax=Rhododendron molle TaxID=49168 RepID=A0ACC0P4H4_RHOML|nr:hypothetical protein RHMOL_Rhmol04G0209700 [Rhododendron molle]
MDGGRKEEDQADDAASLEKDTTIPSSSIASRFKTPENVTPPVEVQTRVATPPSPTTGDGQSLDVSTLGLSMAKNILIHGSIFKTLLATLFSEYSLGVVFWSGLHSWICAKYLSLEVFPELHAFHGCATYLSLEVFPELHACL